MKIKHLLLTIIILLLAANTWAADSMDFSEPSGNLGGGIGMVWIDGKPYYRIQAAPEIKFGKLGAGLNLDILYNPDPDSAKGEESIRKDDLQLTKIIRYISYGSKGDQPVYFRIGDMSATLGSGFIMRRYNNQLIENRPKIGLALDLDMGKGGAKTIIGNLGRMEVMGGRLFVRPFKIAGISLPLAAVENMDLGITYIMDKDQDMWGATDDKVAAYGADFGIPLFDFELLGSGTNLKFYGAYAKLSATAVDTLLKPDGEQYLPGDTFGGSGNAIGLEYNLFGLAGMVDLALNAELRNKGKEFTTPPYFDSYYERDRYDEISNARKSYALVYDDESYKGAFGALKGQVMQKATFMGSFEKYEADSSGVLYAEATLPKGAVPKVWASATYEKRGINTAKDIGTLDERSLASANVDYQYNSFMVIGVTYIWTWIALKDEDGEYTGAYKSVGKVSPRIGFNFDF